MLKTGLKLFLFFLIVFTTFKCIDPFYPKLDGYKPLLVVDGLITNDNRSYVVRLSYTKEEKDSATTRLSDAEVSIADETGLVTPLTAEGNGIYRTDSLFFRGEVGKSYVLHIKTPNGSDYESDTCTMMPVPGIDSIYYGKDVQVSGNQSVARTGLSVYIDTRPGVDDKYFLRWEYEETWRFQVPYPQLYDYINDTTILQLSPANIKEFCWRNSSSSNITTGAILAGQSNLKKQPVQFISTELSDRLTIRYSILVKQYSVSQKEYEYWNNLKQVNETQGDIFGAQPFAVVSNIKNINNPAEQVLGYFQVSGVEQKRKYIDYNEILPLNLPFYNYGCQRIIKGPSDYPVPIFAPAVTFNDIYAMFMSKVIYTFIEPVYSQSGRLTKLVFSLNDCSNCEKIGTSQKPEFWQDK